MFKKINQYLITNYPLVWNLKLVWILAIGILANLIAFVNGFFSFNSKTQLLEYNLFDIFYNNNYFIFYFITCLIILIIWLYFYIKNNRFKSKYPTSRNYLFKEFLGVFSILLLFLTIPNMFKLGLTTRVANYISDEQFEKDVDLINRTSPFTLQKNTGYSNYSRNLSVPVFDSLVTNQEVLELHAKKEKEHYLQYPLGSYTDLIEPYFRNEEFNELLYDKLKAQYPKHNVNFQETYYEYDKDKSQPDYTTYYEPDVVEEVISSTEDEADNSIKIIYSLYNFSNYTFEVPNHPEFTHKYYDEQLIKTLQNNDRKEIERLLTAYQKLLDQHKIGYEFKTKKWIDYIPNAPYFFVKDELQNSTKIQNKVTIYKDHVNVISLNQLYKNVEKAKYNSSIFADFQFFMLFALGVTILIITFRFSSFKVWLISLVGFLILGIIFSCIQLVLNAVGIDFYQEYIIAILFYILFLAFIIYGLYNHKNKIITGVALNWFVITTTFIGLLILSFYKEVKIDQLAKKIKVETYETYNHPEIKFLDDLQLYYLFYLPIVFIIFFYFVINWYKKWQAMPEE